MRTWVINKCLYWAVRLWVGILVQEGVISLVTQAEEKYGNNSGLKKAFVVRELSDRFKVSSSSLRSFLTEWAVQWVKKL